MKPTANEFSESESSSQDAKRIFHEHQQAIYKLTDRLFAGLMVLQWLAAITIAILISPRTWAGASSQIHPHVWAAVLLGGIIAILPAALGVFRPGATSTRYVIAIAQMLMGSLLIHLTGGRIETHFHVFGSLAFLAFYRDWRVLVPATLVVVLDHLFRGLFWPQSVYGVLSTSIWRTLEHAGWVVFEDVVLILSCLHSRHDMWTKASQNAVLDAKERRFRSLITAMSQVVWTANADGRVEEMPQWSALTGQSPTEVTGLGWLAAVHPEDRELATETWNEAVRTGSVYTLEYRIRRADGEYGYYAVRAVPVAEADGTVQEWVGICADVNDRKQAEEALRQAHDELEIRVNERTIELSETNDALKEEMARGRQHEEQLRFQKSLLECQKEASLDGILVISGDRKVISFNQPLCQLWGIPDEIFAAADLGEPLSAILEKLSCPEEFLNRIEYLYEHEDEESSEEVLLADGRTFDRYSAPVKSAEGVHYGRVWYFRDISARKQNEADLYQARDAALESARLKSEFLANMSHEIRTPMNGVIGMTGLLLDTKLNRDQREFAETIRSSGDALLTIINDILDFSKIEAGKLQFETLDFDLNNTIEDSVESLADQAIEKRIELASFIDGDLPTALQGDPGRLRQVLTNLIGNALKFTTEGEVVVRAEKDGETDNDVLVRFTVNDTGIGISEAALPHLFKAFIQADGSTTRKFGGTGLGLAISKQLVELMGGQIGVASTPGEGSAFWFTARFQKQAVALGLTQPAVADLNNLRVLIVDDNATNRTILSHQVGSWGASHDEADSGRRALDMLRSGAAAGAPYHLAILDLMMPEMDGLDLARAIKEDSAIAGVLLVLLTSYVHRGLATTARDIGVAAYLNKPVRQSQLRDCLRTVVSRSSGTTGSEDSQKDPATKLVTIHTLDTTPRLRDKIILIADDNIVNQKVAIRQLRKLGYRADAVGDGREALGALAMVPYDLVLMDCQMPEMDGYEATTEIRAREGKTKHTPIVAMTAHALPSDRAKCIEAGMDDYISKPVSPEELERVLNRFFKFTSVEKDPLDQDGRKVSEPSATTSDDSPPVDLSRVYLVMGDDPEELVEMITDYLEETSKSLERLKRAIEAEDAETIGLIAHNCAGVNANCGMTALIEPLRQLERLALKKRLEGAAVLGQQISREFERVRHFLHENLREVLV